MIQLDYKDGQRAGTLKVSPLNFTIIALATFAIGMFYHFGQAVYGWIATVEQSEAAYYAPEEGEVPVTMTLADISGISSSAPASRASEPPTAARPTQAPKPEPPKAMKVVPADFKSRAQYDYVKRFHEVAIGEQAKFGIPASIKLAQGLLESRAGQASLAAKHNNHFGMKCHSKKCPKGHCVNHADDSNKDFFRVYANAWESWRAHSNVITSSRYASIGGKCGTEYKCWAESLKKAGYATDPVYDQKLIGLIEDLRLWRFDQGHTIVFQ